MAEIKTASATETLRGDRYRIPVDRRTRRWLRSLRRKGFAWFTFDPEEAREQFSNMQSENAPRPDSDIEDTHLALCSGAMLPVRIVRPAGVVHSLPIIVFLHGGGWIMGNRVTYDRLIREIAVRCDAAVFFIDYALAPEAQHPTQNEQAYAALVHIAAQASLYKVKAESIAVVGDGAGATLAANAVMRAKVAHFPAIRIQVLLYPIAGDLSDSDSYQRYSELPTLSAADVEIFFYYYFPDAAARRLPDALPLNASADDMRGLPETLIIAGEFDALRDDAEALANKLRYANVLVSYRCYRGALHGFVSFDALAETDAARAALEHFTLALKRALHDGVDHSGFRGGGLI
jgi:acetyl esterase